MLFIGIDVGFGGGISRLSDNGSLEFSYPFPTHKILRNKKSKSSFDMGEMVNLFTRCKADNQIVCIEGVFSMPGQGVSGVFEFGRSKGIVEALSFAILNPTKVIYVAPQSWKRFHGLIGADKKKSVDLTNKIYGTSFSYSQDGMAESILIARYVWAKENELSPK